MTNHATLNVVSIAFNFIGALLIFFNSPQNNSRIDGGNAFTDNEKIFKRDQLKNKLMKLGFGFMIIGTVLQVYLNVI